MAAHFPSTLFETQTMTLPLSRSQRLEMEHAIEVAIALLDHADGDCDLEDDELHDDHVDIFGEALDYREDALSYGVDQTTPIRFGFAEALGSVFRPIPKVNA